MRYFLIFFILFTSIIVNSSEAQRVVRKGVVETSSKKKTVKKGYDIALLSGKWQEIDRMESGKSVDFSDTLFLNFNKRDSVISRSGMEMSQKGHAAVEDDQLTAAGDVFTIRFNKKGQLKLYDGVNTKTMEKRKAFYSDSLGNIRIAKENLGDAVKISFNDLAGKWNVYKTQAVPGTSNSDSFLIKALTFSILQNEFQKGEVSFQKGAEMRSTPFHARIENKQLLIISDLHTWMLDVFKSDGKEFIFGKEGGVVYFSKKF